VKKIFSIVLASLMVLGLAATAFAIHAEIPAETQSVVSTGTTQVTLGGEIRTRGWYFDNLKGGLGDDDGRSAAWWDERVRLNVQAVVAPGVVGYVELETHSDFSGDKYVWGTGNTLGVGKHSNGAAGTNAKPGTYIDVLQAWILYSGSGLFGFDSGLKVGHMPLKLSYGQFFDNTQYGDDALVLYMNPIKPLHIAALTIKFNECVTGGDCRFDNTNDLDGYVGLLTYKWDDKNTIGVNYTYLNQSDLELQMSDLGLHADGAFGAFGYKVQGDIQFGSVGNRDEKDIGGWALSGYANYDFTPSNVPLNLRGSVVYGSGEGDNRDDSLDEFIPFVGNIQNYSFIYEYNHATTAFNKSGLNSAFPSDGHAAGVANTFYLNLGLDWFAMKDLTLSADLYGFWASDTGAFEHALRDAGVHHHDVSSDAGWEIDAKMKYKVARNLVYQIDAGYFGTGSFYEDAYGIDKHGVTALRHSLTLSF
jgi:hypothetical protein